MIKAGDVYKLEVNGLVDSEAYVRVCVSKRYSEYINGPETLEGAKNLPEFRGKRFMIKPSAQEVFILRVEEDNIAIQRWDLFTRQLDLQIVWLTQNIDVFHPKV